MSENEKYNKESSELFKNKSFMEIEIENEIKIIEINSKGHWTMDMWNRKIDYMHLFKR